MKRFLATLVTAICGAALMGAYLVPTAEAAPYTPKTGVVFNNAAGNKTAERRAQTVLDKTISAVPGCPTAKAHERQTITMAMYLFSQKSTADRLIAAHKRGVNVHILIDNGAEGRAAVPAAQGVRHQQGAAAATWSSATAAAACRTTRTPPST